MNGQLYERGGEGWSGGGGRRSNSTKVSQWVTTGTLLVSSGICALLTVPNLQVKAEGGYWGVITQANRAANNFLMTAAVVGGEKEKMEACYAKICRWRGKKLLRELVIHSGSSEERGRRPTSIFLSLSLCISLSLPADFAWETSFFSRTT